MTLIWGYQNDNGDVFDRHTERMKLFGKFHPFVREGRNRHDNTISSDSDAILLLSHFISLCGGTKVPLTHTDWTNLISIWKVTPRRFSRS